MTMTAMTAHEFLASMFGQLADTATASDAIPMTSPEDDQHV